ncbi:UbiE/COQ5-like protein methyltransferase [Gammaproteobacteria bacterium]
MSHGLQIDWYRHYMEHKRVAPLHPGDLERQLQSDAPFLEMVAKQVPSAGQILECGCGLARTAMSMAHTGYRITLLDHDPRLLEQVRISARQLALTMNYLQGDFFRLDESVQDKSFDGVTHQGVLEHYDSAEILVIIAQQLRVAPVVVCSVPIKTPYNLEYFQDNLYRNLWPEVVWRERLHPAFQVVESLVVRQRTDNLIMALKAA